MARLHSKKKGKAGSRKVKRATAWVEVDNKEISKIVSDLAKAGTPPSKIGHILRDQYGVPDVKALVGKSLLAVVEETKKMEYPENLINLVRKAVSMRTHLEKNRSDVHNRVKLQSVESKIRRLGKYYVKSGKLPEGWVYDPSKAALLVK